MQLRQLIEQAKAISIDDLAEAQLQLELHGGKFQVDFTAQKLLEILPVSISSFINGVRRVEDGLIKQEQVKISAKKSHGAVGVDEISRAWEECVVSEIPLDESGVLQQQNLYVKIGMIVSCIENYFNNDAFFHGITAPLQKLITALSYQCRLVSGMEAKIKEINDAKYAEIEAKRAQYYYHQIKQAFDDNHGDFSRIEDQIALQESKIKRLNVDIIFMEASCSELQKKIFSLIESMALAAEPDTAQAKQKKELSDKFHAEDLTLNRMKSEFEKENKILEEMKVTKSAYKEVRLKMLNDMGRISELIKLEDIIKATNSRQDELIAGIDKIEEEIREGIKAEMEVVVKDKALARIDVLTEMCVAYQATLREEIEKIKNAEGWMRDIILPANRVVLNGQDYIMIIFDLIGRCDQEVKNIDENIIGAFKKYGAVQSLITCLAPLQRTPEFLDTFDPSSLDINKLVSITEILPKFQAELQTQANVLKEVRDAGVSRLFKNAAMVLSRGALSVPSKSRGAEFVVNAENTARAALLLTRASLGMFKKSRIAKPGYEPRVDPDAAAASAPKPS